MLKKMMSVFCTQDKVSPAGHRRTHIVLICVFMFATVAMSVSGSYADETLFGELGGQKGLTQIASDLVDNALIDPRIKASFDNVNIPRLKQHLYIKFCSLADGPCVYKGRDMQRVHAGLHLHEGDFNALAEDLETAMEKSDIPYSVQSRFLGRLAELENQVVSR